jgi:cardiolipin synthase (CMP-forming)
LAHKHEATTLGSKFLTFPNLLTATRLILIAPIVLAILTNNMIPAALLVVLSFGTDVADGRIARYLKQESVLGRMLDFTADRLNLICLLSSLFISI